MRKRIVISVILLLVIISINLSTSTTSQVGNNATALATEDGLVLNFNKSIGKFSSLQVQGYAANFENSAALGIYLYDQSGDIILDANNAPLEAYQEADNTIQFTREVASKHIRATEKWNAYRNYIELQAKITSTEQPLESKSIEACVQLPLDLIGKKWHDNLHQTEIIEQRQMPYETLLTKLIDIGSYDDGSDHMKSQLEFNLQGLNLIGDDHFGLALAINPAKPAAYYVRYDTNKELYSACFHLGIYKDHTYNKDSVEFSLVFFTPNDPEWGLRSALSKYVSIYPDYFLGSLGRQTGMVVGGEYNYRDYARPEDFHIGAMWNGFNAKNKNHGVYNLAFLWPTGFEDRGARFNVTEATDISNSTDTSFEADASACLNIYKDFDQARKPFEEICIGADLFNQCGSGNSNGKSYGPVYGSNKFYYIQPFQVTINNRPNFIYDNFNMYTPFVNSMLQDESAKHVGIMTNVSALFKIDWDQNYYRCFFNGLNPDPGITTLQSTIPDRSRIFLPMITSSSSKLEVAPTQLENFGQLNIEIAKRANGLYGNNYLYTDPVEGPNLYNGAAVDTVGAYLRPDFNPAQLRSASFPLGYDKSSGKIVSFEHLNLLSFIESLRASLPKDRPMAMNGSTISGVLGQSFDFFIEELSQRYRDGKWVDELYDEDIQTRLRRIDRIRMSAYQRPITFWARFDRATSIVTAPDGTTKEITDEAKLLEQLKQYLPLYTSEGIYINLEKYGYNGEKLFWADRLQNQAIIQEYAKHLDAVHELNVAGWQPIPFAQPIDQLQNKISSIIIERFGSKFLTIYNVGDQKAAFRVKVDLANIGLNKNSISVRDRETGESIPFTISGDTLTTSGLSLANGANQILAFEAGNSEVSHN